MHKEVEVPPGRADAAVEFANQAKRLGYQLPSPQSDQRLDTKAVEAIFVTGQDPVIETADGNRLPAVPVKEALRLNKLKDISEGRPADARSPIQLGTRQGIDGTIHGAQPQGSASEKAGAPLPDASARPQTHPLFPPMPMYGPPSMLRDVQCICFRVSSFILSLCFLLVIVLGAIFTSIPMVFTNLGRLVTGTTTKRPFHEEETSRKVERRKRESRWQQKNKTSSDGTDTPNGFAKESFPPLEGGPDELRIDPRYYARREGLELETFSVTTEDGFVIQLWHLLDPKENASKRIASDGKPGSKYPVLMMHGLLQSSGAFCCTEDHSLAFYLAKAGYDVWLGNNRCGLKPEHVLLKYKDPRMWAWNIRQMGVMDLPALITKVLTETGFEKLGLICHSQGTTQTFVALAKEQRPDIGEKISVFCALAPAVYAGPLIKKMYFKFMRIISPSMFRMLFGIHAFIPMMMDMHQILPRRLFGKLGYHVFSFLFNWTDERWERDLRDRMFQFAPVYVSSESMRWWLGRECFAKHKCILATRAEAILEDEEDQEEDDYFNHGKHANAKGDLSCHCEGHHHKEHERFSWYDSRAPPMAFWVCGNDQLVDGRRLLRRFDHGREPFVDLVHRKIIEGYEHLDVIWAMDAIDKVGVEVKEVIWRTAPRSAKKICRIPEGCDQIKHWEKSSNSTLIDASSGEWAEDVRETQQ